MIYLGSGSEASIDCADNVRYNVAVAVALVLITVLAGQVNSLKNNHLPNNRV